MIYLDSAATTKINRSVLDAMMPYLIDEYANPGSIYPAGVRARSAINDARQKVADFLNCDTDQIVFTSGGSEGNSLIINGVKQYLSIIGKKHIITTEIEHESVLRAFTTAAIKDGFICDFIKPTFSNCIDQSSIANIIKENTGFISIMMMNNETGVVNNVKEIAKLCKKYGILFHSDCVQSAGINEIDVRNIECDFATISSHKIHGPKGVGAVFIKNKNIITPSIFGSESQEFGLRGGTENVAGIVGFGEACKIAKENLELNRKHIAKLRKTFAICISDYLPDVIFNGYDTGEKILSITIPDVNAQSLILAVGNDVQISAGSACNSYSDKPSHVLMAIGLNKDEASRTIRVSFSETNTLDEVIEAAKIIYNTVLKLRVLH